MNLHNIEMYKDELSCLLVYYKDSVKEKTEN